MSGPLWRHFMRRQAGLLIPLWFVPVLIALVAGLVYPTYAENRDKAAPFLNILSKLFNDQVGDLLAPGGFFRVPFNHPLTLLAAAVAAGAPALSMPAGERGRGALDVLLASPLTRRRLVRTVAAAVAPIAACFGFAPFVGVYVGASLAGVADQVPFERFAVASLNCGALAASFGAAALLISVVSSDGAAAARLYVAAVALAMATDAVSVMWRRGAKLRWFGPIGYYRPSEITDGRANLALCFGVLVGATVLLFAAAEVVADRRRRA